MKKRISPLLIFSLLLLQSSSAQAIFSISAVPMNNLPAIGASSISSLDNPGMAPTDITTLAPRISKSVVTLICGNKQGSAWSVNVDLTLQQKDTGFNSYLITNHHVIADCTNGNGVTIILPDKTKSEGIVLAWDESNDLAGVLTSSKIPALNWQGSAPLQGYWVGVLGSPLGIAGVLTSGLVSSIGDGTLIGTLTAPINPGNSGGPVFDRSGRVIGVATAKYVNAEGFGIFNGTPLLCKNIINCVSGSNIWFGQTRATKIFATNPYLLNQNAITFQELNGEKLGILYCSTAPAITDENIITGKITGTFWRITDLTESKVLDSFMMPIQKSDSNVTQKNIVENGLKLSTKTADGVRTYSYTLRNQQKGHVYECAISIVVQDSIGEFTTTTANAEVNESNFNVLAETTPTPVLTPTAISKKPQKITGWNIDSKISLTNQSVKIELIASSRLPVNVGSISQSVCLVSGSELVLIKAGRCVVTAAQSGNEEFDSAESKVFVVDLVTKKNTSLTCVKGKLIKKISAVDPHCPKGYKKR